MAINIGSGKIPGKDILDTPGKALAEVGNFIANPFAVDVPDSIQKPDYPHGFNFVEYIEGKEATYPLAKVRLAGTWMIKQPFNFGGLQRHVKEFYAGNSEPSMQILGPEEKDIVVQGTINSKKLNLERSFREVALETQKQMDAIRIRGNLLRIEMDDFRRFGFLVDTDFNLRTKADLDYQLTFSIIGFNPPLHCNQIDTSKEVPFSINKELITAAADFQDTYTNVPDSVPQSIGDLIRGAISDVMEVVTSVTGFIDTTLSAVEDVASSINRATALVKFAQAELSRYRRRVGTIGFTDFSGNTTTISQYLGFSFVSDAAGSSWELSDYLTQLSEQLAALQETVPLARHRVAGGETLQTIAIKFYNDSKLWEEIYDHNSMTSTQLTVGDVIEIPQI